MNHASRGLMAATLALGMTTGLTVRGQTPSPAPVRAPPPARVGAAGIPVQPITLVGKLSREERAVDSHKRSFYVMTDAQGVKTDVLYAPGAAGNPATPASGAAIDLAAFVGTNTVRVVGMARRIQREGDSAVIFRQIFTVEYVNAPPKTEPPR